MERQILEHLDALQNAHTEFDQREQVHKANEADFQKVRQQQKNKLRLVVDAEQALLTLNRQKKEVDAEELKDRAMENKAAEKVEQCEKHLNKIKEEIEQEKKDLQDINSKLTSLEKEKQKLKASNNEGFNVAEEEESEEGEIEELGKKKKKESTPGLPRKIQLSDEQLKEYIRLKADVEREVVKERADIERDEPELASKQQIVDSLDGDIKRLIFCRDRHNDTLKDVKEGRLRTAQAKQRETQERENKATKQNEEATKRIEEIKFVIIII